MAVALRFVASRIHRLSLNALILTLQFQVFVFCFQSRFRSED